MGSREEYLEEIAERLEEYPEDCPVCGAKAEVVCFGNPLKGVWVGCCRSMRCARNIEYHKEGWSVEDAIREWNRKNRGLAGILRKAKRKVEDMIGKRARAEKEYMEKKAKEKRQKREALWKAMGVEKGI